MSIEKLYPCIKLAWGSGRPTCSSKEIEGAPPASIDKMDDFSVFSTRYGLTPEEFATITTFAHSVPQARNFIEDSGIFSFLMSNELSPVKYIQRMIDPASQWTFFGTWFGLDQSDSGGPGPGTMPNNIGRFPSDFMFFPSVLNSTSLAEPDFAASSVETLLTSFATADNGDSQFKNAFAAAFEKLLSLGASNLTPFHSSNNSC